MRSGSNPLSSAFQASPWETIRLAKEPKEREGHCHRDLSVMNANDAKGIGEEPWEYCMEDIKEALKVSLAHPPRETAKAMTHTHYQTRLTKLRREIDRRVD